MNRKIRVAIAGVGNCASALVQGLAYYRGANERAPGLISRSIAGYLASDIEIVAAFDIDKRKVGAPLHQAIFAAPNCAMHLRTTVAHSGIIVKMGPILDGVASHMADFPEERAFRLAAEEPVDVAAELARSGARILVSYLPVGAERAVRHYAEACLSAGVALVNCVPVFVASDPVWAERFRAAGLPLVGDDVKSQVGATIVHRVLAHLLAERGYTLERTYQLNVGGNTDFLNMKAQDRLSSKKISKTNAVQSVLPVRLPDDDIHIGPSDYVPWQRDNKVAFMRFEAMGFGQAPLSMEIRLSVEDSPNSAAVVVDTIRCAQVALDRRLAGSLEAASAAYMKSPPRQMEDQHAARALSEFLAGGA